MKIENDLQTPTAPSKQKLAKATAGAFVVAVVILFVAVLPAEYGIDPLGTGTALGLTSLSEARGATADGPVTTAPVVVGAYTPQPKVYKIDTEELTLGPHQGVELKYHLEKGAVMVYAWRSTAPVESEFHGEPDVKPNPEYYDSYELDKVGKDRSNGSFTAPSTGIHGWFWENKTDKSVEVHLTTAGFYSKAILFGGAGKEDIEVPDVE
jgi:hypothetical protein